MTYLNELERALMRRGASGGRPASEAVLFVPLGSSASTFIESAIGRAVTMVDNCDNESTIVVLKTKRVFRTEHGVTSFRQSSVGVVSC